MRRLILTLALVCALQTSAIAGPREDALAAYESKDYGTALRLFRPLANSGDSIAQYSLGFMYMQGIGVPQDYAEAIKWFLPLADTGQAHAQGNIGYMYHQGLGVPLDYAEAIKWYRKAAEQDNPFAQKNLGAMYIEGKGVPQDYVEAHKWLNLAAAHYPSSNTEGRDAAVRIRDLIASKMTPVNSRPYKAI